MVKKMIYTDSKGKKYNIITFESTLGFPVPTEEEWKEVKKELEKVIKNGKRNC